MRNGKYTSIKIDIMTYDRITEWRRNQPDLPSPGEAVRRLLAIGLDAEGVEGTTPVENDQEPVKPEPVTPF